MEINLKTLIGKLNDSTRTAATRAGRHLRRPGPVRGRSRTPVPGPAGAGRCDFALIARRLRRSVPARSRPTCAAKWRASPPAAAARPVFSIHLPALFEHAWLIASLGEGAPRQIRTHLLLALLTEPALAQLACRGSALFAPAFPSTAQTRTGQADPWLGRGARRRACRSRRRACRRGRRRRSGHRNWARACARRRRGPVHTNLTERARAGALDPVIGRDARDPPGDRHPDAAAPEQPDPDRRGGRGQDRRRRRAWPAASRRATCRRCCAASRSTRSTWVCCRPAPASRANSKAGSKTSSTRSSAARHAIILFIDEAHTMIGAGGAAGQTTRPICETALCRGELRTVAGHPGASTRKYFEKERAPGAPLPGHQGRRAERGNRLRDVARDGAADERHFGSARV